MIPHILLLLLVNQQLYEMDEIVVTATRYPLALQNIAVATMVIDRTDIESLHALEISEVLRGIAGVDVKDYGTPGSVTSVTLRGIPTNGTLVLVNGQPLNTATTGMADLSVIDINSVERIEIVKGPVSSIYGANTLGGVVNIITKKEHKEPGVRVHAMPFATSFDTLPNAYIGIAAHIPYKHMQTSVSAAYLRSSGQRSNSDLTKYDIQGAVVYNAKRLVTSVHVVYDNKEYGLPGPQPYIDSLCPKPIFGDSTATSLFDNEQDRTLLGNIDIAWEISERMYWEQRLYGDRRESDFHTQYTGWLGDTIIEENTYLTYSGGYNTMLLMKFSGLDVSIGLDARFDSLYTQTFSEQSGDTTWNASTYTVGGWCQAKKDFLDIISFTSSIRVDYNEEFGTFFSPSIGFISVLQSNLIFKTSAGRTFRAPSLNDLYWPLSGNQNLTPEYGWEYEVRVETAPAHWMLGAVSLFMRNIKDRIAWMPDTGSLWKPQNINELSIVGVDLEYQAQITTFMDLALQATYLAATQQNNEIVYDFYDWMADTGLTIIQEIERDAAFIPQYSLKLSQHIHAPYSFTIDLSELYVSEIRNYYTNYDSYPIITMDEKGIDGYFLLNASMTKTFCRFVSVTIGLKNAFDAAYATQFGYSVTDLNYPMPGRTYFLQVSACY